MYSQDFASDVGVELLKKLGFEQAIFVGHSVGGLLSMLTYLRKPEVFKGIVLLDAPLVQGDPSGLLQWSMNREVLGKYLTKSLVKNIQGIFVNMYSDPARANDPILKDKYARPFETVQDAQKALWRYIKRNISFGPKLRGTTGCSLLCGLLR
jgi:pimeloyl-ACP methyl ester carboxylesterase